MSLVKYEIEDGLAVLTLTRAEKRNAMNQAMLNDLDIAVCRAAEDDARAAILTGDGDHFSAGLDLAEAGLRKGKLKPFSGSQSWYDVFRKIKSGSIPYFAALHGGVIGGGLELAAITHVRVADETAFFALPEGQRGIFVGGGGSASISRIIGVTRMVDMMLTGRVLTVKEAEALDIVTYITPPGEALAKAKELARTAMENTSLSNYAIINAIERIHDSGMDEGQFFESILANYVRSTPEAAERMLDFVEKRGARVKAPSTSK